MDVKPTSPTITAWGFTVRGTKYGGWVLLDASGSAQYVAAFSSFAELLEWLGDNNPDHDGVPERPFD